MAGLPPWTAEMVSVPLSLCIYYPRTNTPERSRDTSTIIIMYSSMIHSLSSFSSSSFASTTVSQRRQHPSPFIFPGVWSVTAKDKQGSHPKPISNSRCSALSRSRTRDVFQQNELPVITWRRDGGEEEDGKGEQTFKIPTTSNDVINEYVKAIKSMLSSMEDGEINVSAYDTAWVALVEDVKRGTPQFASSLKWISENQLQDGSWGDARIFSAHDRLLNTLACVVALKKWNLHPDKCQKGMEFFRENLCKLEDENEEQMPIGFEVAFPSLLEIARGLDIEVPMDSRVLQDIYASRNLKLEKIPKDIMHSVPTTLLHSLEGMPRLDWEKLLKLQSQDGSFLFSPSSTAYALMQTQDHNCLSYLNMAVQKFQGGVPNVYPVDLFEHIWVVDRLQRLGISRYFQAEIQECVDYVHRYWTEEGICWARNSTVQDIDDTAMAFRLLRLHGYDVSADVFKHFQKGGGFFCFAGQTTQAVTGMFNLYRASQVMFPGENILEDANRFSAKFLREKQAANQLLDKWIIMKDLPGEVGFALDVPWCATLPRLEARFYLEQYGGENDVWIGKTLYRMPYVSNNTYLELAKLDFNNCQALHRIEWDKFQMWYQQSNLKEFGISSRDLLTNYYVAVASIFEPERSNERLAWAKTASLLDAIEGFFDGDNTTNRRRAFVHAFKKGTAGRMAGDKRMQELLWTVLKTVNDISFEELVVRGRDISQPLRHAWEKWLVKWEEEGDRRHGEGLLLVETINLTAGNFVSPTSYLAVADQYHRLSTLTNSLCARLSHFQKNIEVDRQNIIRTRSPEIESEMQEVAQLVLQKSCEDMGPNTKTSFLAVARSFYYTAICDPNTINLHASKVLFERVL